MTSRKFISIIAASIFLSVIFMTSTRKEKDSFNSNPSSTYEVLVYSKQHNKEYRRYIDNSIVTGENYTRVLETSNYIELPNFSTSHTDSELYFYENFIYSINKQHLELSQFEISNQISTNLNLRDYFDSSIEIILYYFDDMNGILYLAGQNAEGTIISKLDSNFEPVELGYVNFYFTQFFVLDNGKSFLFYSPMSAYEDEDIFIFTNLNFDIVSTFGKIDQIVKDYNVLASNLIKVFNNKIYYNPVLTDLIYEVDPSGNLNLIFEGFNDDSNNLQKQKLVKSLNQNSYESYLCRDIMDYFISEDFIYLYRISQDKKQFYTIYERNSGKSIILQSKIRLTKLDAPFNLIFDRISGIEKDYIYSIRNNNIYSQILYNLTINNSEVKIYDGLEKILKANAPAIHKYSYDFDFIYSLGE
jgi:hypothetical protein